MPRVRYFVASKQLVQPSMRGGLGADPKRHPSESASIVQETEVLNE